MSADIAGAAASDVQEIYALGSETFPTWRVYFPAPTRLESLISQGTSSGWVILAAREGGSVTGFAVVSPQEDGNGTMHAESIWCELKFVASRPDRRRQGIGSDLLAAATEPSLSLGYLGMMASIQPGLANWYGTRAWNVGPTGGDILLIDAGTARTTTPAWNHPSDQAYPVWIWRALDPTRPVRAWTPAIPGNSDLLYDELERQQAYFER